MPSSAERNTKVEVWKIGGLILMMGYGYDPTLSEGCRRPGRSKIMRRIPQKSAKGEPGALEDTSTLADPGVVEDLVSGGAERS